MLYREIVRMAKSASRTKNVWIKVHTRRERRVVTDIYNFSSCFDYPLAFLSDVERTELKQKSDRTQFLAKHGFAANAKIMGLFGYISEYKGIETAINALSELPDEYELAIFGGHHPQAIQPNTPIHPYLQSLLDLISETDDRMYKRDLKVARLKRMARAPINFSDEDSAAVVKRRPIEDRVRFIGTLEDPEFIEALKLVDTVVLPYLEVGQSMSGIVVLGMESGAKMICASNHSFFETSRYFGNVFESFDMGNYVELASKVKFGTENPQRLEFTERRDAAYEKYNIRSSVLEQLSHFAHKS